MTATSRPAPVVPSSDRPASAVEAAYPMSPLQQGMLLHAFLAPGTGVNLVQTLVDLQTRVDPQALRLAWQKVADRHAILRTAMAWEGVETPMQRVHRRVDVPLHVEDWRGRSGPEQDGSLEAFLANDRAREFELDSAPLWRVALFRTGEQASRMVFTWHHSVLDGRACPLVIGEALRLLDDPQTVLSPPRPFEPFVAWLARQDWTEAEKFWRAQLRGIHAPTPLTVDHAADPAAVGRVRRGADELTLSADVAAELRQFADRHRLSLNTLVQGAWALLLWHYSGEPDVVFGATRRCRAGDLEHLEDIAGPTINTVPLRVAVRADQPLLEWLMGLRAQWRAMRPYEHAPLARITAWSEIPAGLPLIDSIVVFENRTIGSALTETLGSAAASRVRYIAQTNYALTLAADAGEDFVLKIEYDRARFEPAVIRRMLEQVRTLLVGMIAAPEQPLGAIDVLPVAEREQVVRSWNATERSYPLDQTLPALLEAQAVRTPDAPALTFEAETLSYRALHARADRLAQHLRSLGVGVDTRVGLCAERSLELVVGLLAILKAGGAYVPLDPEYPAERLAFMFADAAPTVLLTQSRLVPALPPFAGPVVCLDASPDAVAKRPVGPSAPVGGPDDLAYMIYTSGSTGRPKGALNTHRGIVNRLCWMQERFQLTARDAVLQKTPFSFDVSVWEFFWPLITGARLVLARPGGHRDPTYLRALIAREGVTILHFVPSMLRAFLAEPVGTALASVRDVMASGEALPHDLVQAFFAQSRAGLHNLYGPTEAAVDVTCWSCGRDDPGPSVPIGAPIANTRLYVLDARGRPTPIGVPGELFIGGVQVGRGYWQRDALTAERFVPDGFGPPGARLYRTGDRARWRADGVLEYLGRLDFQVKLRGYRIELGEIEAALGAAPGIREAAVALHREGAAEPRLVGYLVAEPGTALDHDAIRGELQRTLPDYMVPALLIELPGLPMSPNGKLDRKALPAPQAGSASSGREYLAPRSESEEALAGIWAGVLKLDRVGVTDNFYELGGDSILSIFISVRARAAGLELTPGEILQYPTVQAAARIARPRTARITRDEPAQGEVPLTPVQRWFFDLDLPDPAHWNQALLLRVPADLDAAALEAGLAAVAAQHDALRLRFRRSGRQWEQWYDEAAGNPPLEVIDLADIPAESRRPAIERTAAAAQARLDLTDGPVARAILFRCGTDDGRLLLVVHHLVVDGVSWKPLLEDLERAYEAHRRGVSAELPGKTASFKAWSNRLAALAASSDLAEEVSYWAHRSPEALPRDGDGAGPNLEGTARTLVRELDQAATTALLRDVPPVYGTQMNDVLLTALGAALSEWTGRGEATIDLEGHGREDMGVDVIRTVGWFTSVFPVRLSLGARLEPGRDLRAVKESLRAVPRRGAGFGVLRYIAERPELAALPDPELSFNYLGQFDQLVGGSSLFRFAEESSGPWHGARNPRRYALEVNALVVSGRLQLQWTWHPALHREDTVERLAARTADLLHEIIGHCRSPEAGGYSPSDFPLVRLDQESLDRLLGNDRGVEGLYPATPMQRLFHAESSSGNDPGLEQWTYAIKGPLDPEAFRRAWEETVAHHTALRTRFVAEPDGELLQVVQRRSRLPWQAVDWSDASEEERGRRLNNFRVADRARGIALDAAPLLRVTLIRVSAADHLMVWTHHHILIDRLSWPLVLGEVGQRYQALRQGQTLRAEPAPTYQRYVEWLLAQNPERTERFWRSEFEGFGEPILLTEPGAAAGGSSGEAVERLPDTLTAALSQRARDEQVTLNTLVQGAWALWLSRYSGQSDVVYGLAVSGRPEDLPGVEATIGLFINNVPVRLQIDESAQAGPWLRGMQQRQSARQPYESAPLERIHEWSGAPGYYRLFESLVVFQNDAASDLSSSWLGQGVSVETLPVATQTRYPLTLLVRATGSLELRLVYRAGASSPAGAESVLGDLRTLLELMASTSLASLGDLLGRLPPPPTDSAHARRSRGGARPRPALASPYVAPATAVECYLARTWRGLLGLGEIGVSDNLFELGVHSLLASRFVARLKDDLQVQLPLRALFDRPTIADLARDIIARETTPGLTERIAVIRERVASMSDAELSDAAPSAAARSVRA